MPRTPSSRRRVTIATMLATVLIVVPSAAMAQAEAQPVTPDTGELTAGIWVDDSNGVPITFSVEDGWVVGGEPIPEVGVELFHEGLPGSFVTFTNFGGEVFSGPCATAESAAEFFDGEAVASTEASAQGLADHLEAHPYVSVEETTPVTVGGYEGLQLDMTTSIPPECDPPWAWLWVLPIVGDFHLAPDARARFIALDVGEHVAVIAAEGYGPEEELDWEGFLAQLGALTDSMVITPA